MFLFILRNAQRLRWGGAKPTARSVRETNKPNKKVAARALTSIDLLGATPLVYRACLRSSKSRGGELNNSVAASPELLVPESRSVLGKGDGLMPLELFVKADSLRSLRTRRIFLHSLKPIREIGIKDPMISAHKTNAYLRYARSPLLSAIMIRMLIHTQTIATKTLEITIADATFSGLSAPNNHPRIEASRKNVPHFLQ